MKKLRLGVAYGGPSQEHEISVKTGKAMLGGLSSEHYAVTEIFIDKNSIWHINNVKCNQVEALNYIVTSLDFILIGLHGSFGEDGTIQKLLEEKQIAYSGSDSRASSLAIKKHAASRRFKLSGMKVPKEIVLKKAEVDAQHNVSQLGLPIVVKPSDQGSSVGISVVNSANSLAPAIVKAFKEDDAVLLQEFIKGREVSCGVLELARGELRALPPTELVPLISDFFDYKAKYTVGGAKEITPPDLPHKVIQSIQETAQRAHRLLGCSGYSRTDMIIKADDIYVIETNTLPGLTETSILPQQAAAAGITFEQLLDYIINSGMQRIARYNKDHE